MDELVPWRTVESTERLRIEPWLTVRTETVELPDGRRVDGFVQIEQPSFVCIFAETDDGRVVSLRQYRHGPRRVCLTFPGGHIDRADEPPLETARRELMEETGYEAAAWRYLGGYTMNANAGGAVSHMYHATGCRKVAEADSGDLEDTRIELRTRAEMLEAVGRGDMPLITQIALLAMVTNPALAAALDGTPARSITAGDEPTP